MSQLTYSPVTRSPGSRLDLTRAGTGAGLAAGPLFLTTVAINTWASIDFLHGIGWRLIGGKDIPWPSSLAAGPYGWVQITNFLLAGLLILLFAAALRRALPARRASSVAFVALTSAGIAIAASAFPVDPTMIATGDPSTWHGWIHGLAFLVALPSVLIAPVATALAMRGDSRWRPLGKLSVAATLTMITLLALPLDDAGFYLFLTVVFGWIALISVRLQRLQAQRR